MNETATAYHEAGHAIIAQVTGVGIRRRGITIIPDADTHGSCHTRSVLGVRPDRETTGRSRLRAENRVMVSLAGQAAQKRFNPRTVRRYHASADYQSAIRLLSYFVGSEKELEAYIRLLEIRTEQKVENYWPEIEALAKELLKRKHLTGQEALAVFYQAVRSRGVGVSR